MLVRYTGSLGVMALSLDVATEFVALANVLVAYEVSQCGASSMKWLLVFEIKINMFYSKSNLSGTHLLLTASALYDSDKFLFH